MAWREEFYKAVHQWMKRQNPKKVAYEGSRRVFFKDILDEMGRVDSVRFEAELEPGYSCCGGDTLNQYVEVYFYEKDNETQRVIHFNYDPSEFMDQLDD